MQALATHLLKRKEGYRQDWLGPCILEVMQLSMILYLHGVGVKSADSNDERLVGFYNSDIVQVRMTELHALRTAHHNLQVTLAEMKRAY